MLSINRRTFNGLCIIERMGAFIANWCPKNNPAFEHIPTENLPVSWRHWVSHPRDLVVTGHGFLIVHPEAAAELRKHGEKT